MGNGRCNSSRRSISPRFVCCRPSNARRRMVATTICWLRTVHAADLQDGAPAGAQKLLHIGVLVVVESAAAAECVLELERQSLLGAPVVFLAVLVGHPSGEARHINSLDGIE